MGRHGPGRNRVDDHIPELLALFSFSFSPSRSVAIGPASYFSMLFSEDPLVGLNCIRFCSRTCMKVVQCMQANVHALTMHNIFEDYQTLFLAEKGIVPAKACV